ncbi:MAG TPA: T9SS type A sorting domain-containing protein [Candidatus Kapabacteria bacterium]|nr:T9SS type A sorting domain-containing protein [Candidatus Kapabacteria bacterium]
MRSLKCLYFAIPVIAFGVQCSRAQSSLTYNRGGNCSGYEVIPTEDGGFMIGGQASDDAGAGQYWVAKVNAQGKNVSWDSVYDLGYSQSFLWSIQPSYEAGGALLAGYTGVQGSELESALLVKIDSFGRIVKSYDVKYARATHAHWFAHRKQGGYFWGGHTDAEGDPTGDMILQKLDSGMNKLWDSTYYLTINSGEHAHCGALTSDGGCVLAGHTTVNGQEHTWAVRVDSNGVPIWKKLFDSTAAMSESPYRVVETREGDFAIIGGTQSSTASRMRLLVVDSNGNKLIDKLYGTGYSWSQSGIQCSGGGYVLIGYYSTNTTQNALVVRTDAKGNIKWQQQYSGEALAAGYDLFQRNDDQFVLIGATAPNANVNYSDLWVLYIDSNGAVTNYDTAASSVSAEGSIATSLSIFPNPLLSSEGSATIMSSQPVNHVEIFDALGQEVRAISSPHSTTMTWDAKDAMGNSVPSGVYFVRAITASGTVGAKLVIR